jgi:serine/threonine protein kinase
VRAFVLSSGGHALRAAVQAAACDQQLVVIYLRAHTVQAEEDAIDLLSKMVRFDPAQRITAEQALQHRFFTKGAAPTPPARLPRPKGRADAPLMLPPPKPSAEARERSRAERTDPGLAKVPRVHGGALSVSGVPAMAMSCSVD